MIYADTSFPEGGGIIPGEPTVVTAVDSSTGTLSLQYPLARSFSAPYIVRVTSQATWNVGLKNLIVQGWWPLQMYGTFGAVIEGNTFIQDESYFHRGSSVIEMASVRQVLFENNVVRAQSGLQVPDQSGMDVTFDGDTFYSNVGWNFGSEYVANITVQNSHLFLTGWSGTPGVVAGGVNATFSGNDVHVSSWNNPAGLPALFSDYYAGNSFYVPYNGQILVENNTFDCGASALDYCVYSSLPQTALSNNQITATGTYTIGLFITAATGAAVSQTANGNQISVVKADGVYLSAAQNDAAVIEGNTIQSSGGSSCIAVGNPTSGVPDHGSDVITQNTTSGCLLPISININMHPGTSTGQP
jgi:hypothetical protein